MTKSLPPPNVAGLSLDGAAPYIIDAEEDRLLCASVGTEPDPRGYAHPIFFYIATQVGMRETVAGLCRICEFDVNDGPMLVANHVEFFRPLMVGVPYRVRGTIVALERKPSRKLGTIDVLEYKLSLLSGSEPVLATTNKWVLPRRNLQ